MKNRIISAVLLLNSFLCLSQQEVTWDDLSKVTFTEKFFVLYDDYFLYPKFSPFIKSLEGNKIALSGYFLNVDPESKMYILSKGPMSSCFFCGQGGPETAVELVFPQKPNFKTDDIIMVTGTLKLNKDDVEHFNYIMTDCRAKLIQ